MKRLYAGIDVGGTKIRVGLVTGSGSIVAIAKSPTPKDITPGKLVRSIGVLLEQVLQENGKDLRALCAIGIGIPGIVDDKKGVIVRAPNLNLSGVNLKKMMRRVFRGRIALGNDVNLGLLGEQWRGAARGAKNAVSVFIGTGVGGGLLINGSLYAGSHGAAAELGHICVCKDGPPCSCGNHGCLEALAGRWAIERSIRKAVAKGKKTVVNKLLEGNLKSIKSKILSKALRMRDPLVTGIMKEASLNLGAACVSLRHIFDPEVIILGGGVIEACGEFMLPIITKVFRSDKLFSKLGRCDVVASELLDDAVILGAVSLARRNA